MSAHPVIAGGIAAALVIGSAAAPLAVRAADAEPVPAITVEDTAPAAATTEPSVLPALVARQQPDGGWAADGHEPASATAHAVLCFLGEGYDPVTPHRYTAVVAKGVRRLAGMLDERGVASRTVATQAVVAMALAECAAMNGHPDLMGAGRRACLALLAMRLDHGAWPAEDRGRDERPDARACALAHMALRSAQAAGLATAADQAVTDAWFRDAWTRANAGAGPARFPVRDDRAVTAEPDAPQDLPAAMMLAAFARPPHREAMAALGAAALAQEAPSDPESCWLWTLGLLVERQPERWEAWRARILPALDRDRIRTGPDAGCWTVDRRVDVVSTARLALARAVFRRVELMHR